MSFSLVNNLTSLNAQSKLAGTTSKLNSTLQRLSTGLRINKSGDDAAGLAIANSFRSDISILSQGIRNANDGLSTLQIIDGGLNTISGLLDRAATLSSQSASGTFSGNRDTLQAELGKVLTEIDRQAQNVGLGGNAGTAEGRFNKNIDVFIGGGTSASSSNNSVNINLSNSRVDKTGLNLNNLNIGAGAGSVTGDAAMAATLGADETLTFQRVGSDGKLSSFTLSLSSGASSANVMDALNNDANVQGAGIKATLDGSGKLVLSSSQLFTVTSDQIAGGTGIINNADKVQITSAANKRAITASNAGANSTQVFSFSGEQIGYEGNAKTISISSNTVANTAVTGAVTSINNDTDLRNAGVFAVRSEDGEISLISLKKFNLGIENAADPANNSFARQATTEYGNATLTGGEQGAKDALTAIKAAVASLGQVQGKVGAGQNNLGQAIDLATAQISNYQAAESSIRDADIAAEASNMARLNTLQQAGVSALAQANQSSQAVLSLLR